MQRMDIERVGTVLKMLTPEGTSHHSFRKFVG